MLKSKILSYSDKIKPHLQGGGLKARMARGSVWAFVGFGGSTFLRMVSSLVLTRLLMPEIFGLVAILASVIMGITLVSDVGIGVSIVQNPRSKEPAFLRTAWTLQLLRGILLWGVSWLIAWPAAAYYDEPRLVWMLPVAGFALVLTGLTSTSLYIHEKKMWVKRVVCLEIITQEIGLIATMILAYYWRDAWSMIYGGLIGVTARIIATYLYLPGGVVGFQFDRTIVRAIVHFGKWVFVATMMTYLVGQGDRLILGGLMDKSTLGFYNLAAMFSQLPIGILLALMGKTLLPAMVEVAGRGRDELSAKLNTVRAYLIGGILPPALFMAVFGQWVIELFYDPRYLEAGWMLQVLSLGVVAQIAGISMSPIFLSQGDSFRHMISTVSWAVMLVLFMLVGYNLNAQVGLVFGIAAAPFAWLPIVSWLTRKYVDIDHRITCLVIAASALVIGVGWWLVGINIP